MADNYTPTDRDKAWKIIADMTEPIKLNQIISPERMEIFIAHAKEFIDWDMSPDYIIEFNNTYTELRKLANS